MRVIYVGRLEWAKGVQDLIEACRGLDVSLCIVGDGGYRKDLEDMADGMPVTFTGALDRPGVFRELKASDVFVNPSYSEGLPTSVMEAAACGMAIIATDVGGTREIIPAGAGILIPPHNIGVIHANLVSLMLSPHIAKYMGAKAFQESKRFDWNLITEEYERLLKE